MDPSAQLAKLWMTYASIKEQLDNVAIPLANHLGIEDPSLMVAMDELSAEIDAHFEKFRLLVERQRN